MPTLNPGRGSVGGEGGQGEDEAAEDDGEEKEESKGGKRSRCERAMEMTARNLYADYKQDNKNYDGLLNSNGGDMTEIRVPLSQPGKRITPIEGDNLYRLRDRKFLLEDKKRLCAWALGTAILGILLMILHAELCPVIYRPTSIYAFIINGLISLSTSCLLILIVAFHIKDIRLFTIDHYQVDWRIAMTTQRVLGISLELVVCAIHPVATYWLSSVDASMKAIDENGGSHQGTSSNFSSRLCSSAQHKGALLDSEVLLSSLMFLRLYLVHRAILLHSKVLLSASYRSIGSLNNINFTFRFVLKVLMNKYPGRTLLFFILFFWLTASWLLTLCERQIQAPTGSMDTALWLIAITFLTVGYGDVSPQTTCGKMVCLFAGVMGVACTAMLVAVMTKKLALNKGEKHVHYFMMDIQISKRIRHAAANVLRECWLLHRADTRRKASGERRQQQRHLLEAIRVFRYLRLKQRKLRDNANEMVDLPKMQMIMCDLSANWNNSYRELEQRIISMERKLDELGRSFHRPCECHSDLHLKGYKTVDALHVNIVPVMPGVARKVHLAHHTLREDVDDSNASSPVQMAIAVGAHEVTKHRKVTYFHEHGLTKYLSALFIGMLNVLLLATSGCIFFEQLNLMLEHNHVYTPDSCYDFSQGSKIIRTVCNLEFLFLHPVRSWWRYICLTKRFCKSIYLKQLCLKNDSI